MIGTRFISVVLLVTLGFAATTAVAEGGESSIEDARHHMELGQDAFARREFEAAGAEFMAAYDASPFGAFLYNAGLAFEKAGKLSKAIELYKRYLDATTNASDAANVTAKIKELEATLAPSIGGDSQAPSITPKPDVKITEIVMKSLISVRTNPKDAFVRITDAKGGLISETRGDSAMTVEHGAYTVEASHPDFKTVTTEIRVSPGQVYIVVVEMSQGAFLGFLHVISDVPGADVYIDKKEEGSPGKTPFGNAVPAGKHTLWVEKPGYEIHTQDFEMKLGQETRIEVAMRRLPFGTLLVKSNVQPTTVHVDGKLLGEAPFEGKLPPGKHQLVVKSEGMKNYESPVDVNAGQRTKVLVRMNPKPSRTSAWVSAGTAVAFIVGGSIVGAKALELDRELEKERNEGRLASDDKRITKGFFLSLGADLSFGVAAVLSGLSIYYFVRDPLPPSEGKLLSPVDFEENPDGEFPTPALLAPEPETSFRRSRPGPKLSVAPLLAPQTAGMGLTLAF